MVQASQAPGEGSIPFSRFNSVKTFLVWLLLVQWAK